MKTTRLNSSIIIGLIALAMMVNWVNPDTDVLSKIIPDSWVDGPFNPATENPDFLADRMAGNLLYADNGTDLVTYWDETEQQYFTYDQRNNEMLAQVVFNIDLDDADSPYAEYVADSGITGHRRTKTKMVNGKVAVYVNGQIATFEQLQAMQAENRVARR